MTRRFAGGKQAWPPPAPPTPAHTSRAVPSAVCKSFLKGLPIHAQRPQPCLPRDNSHCPHCCFRPECSFTVSSFRRATLSSPSFPKTQFLVKKKIYITATIYCSLLDQDLDLGPCRDFFCSINDVHFFFTFCLSQSLPNMFSEFSTRGQWTRCLRLWFPPGGHCPRAPASGSDPAGSSPGQRQFCKEPSSPLLMATPSPSCVCLRPPISSFWVYFLILATERFQAQVKGPTLLHTRQLGAAPTPDYFSWV